MSEGKNIMLERENSRNRGMQEDWNWQEQGEKNGKGVDGGKVKGNGKSHGWEKQEGENLKRRRADAGRIRERMKSFTISQQLGLAVMGTSEQPLIQQLFIDKYCFWPASETKFTLVLVQKSSRMCDLNFPGPQLVIPGSGTTGRDTRGKCSLMGWKVGSAAFQNKVTTAWNIALVNSDLELLLPGWLLTSFTKETQGHCLPSWITKRANKKYFLGPIRFSTECPLKA